MNKIKSTLGTAAQKNSTDEVTENSTDLVESGAVYTETNSIRQALANQVSTIKNDITDIVATGSTNETGNTILRNTYFYLNGTLVRAKENNIAPHATFTLNTNYEVVQHGGLNGLSNSLFKNVVFDVSKNTTKNVTLSSSTQGIMFIFSQANTCNSLIYFASDSTGYTYKQVVAIQGSTSDIGLATSSYQLSITNNNSSHGMRCTVLIINGAITV